MQNPERFPPRKRFGAKSDPFDANDYSPDRFFDEPAESKVGFSSSKALSLRTLVEVIPNQLGNSCVGYGISSATHLHGKLHGFTIARPSALAIYALAAMGEFQTLPQRWPDDGCQPRLAMRGAQSVGLLPENEWQETADRIGKPVPLQVMRGALAHKLRSYYRVEVDVVDTLKKLLAAGAPSIFHTPVTQAMLDWADEEVITPDVFAGPKLGRHCQAIIGYDDARQAFEVLGSWGAGYADGGCSWISYEVIDSQLARDRYAVTSAPKGLK